MNIQTIIADVGIIVGALAAAITTYLSLATYRRITRSQGDGSPTIQVRRIRPKATDDSGDTDDNKSLRIGIFPLSLV